MEHMEHLEQGKGIKDLACSRHLEQTQETWNSPESETLAAFARRLGVARSTVTRAAQAGRLVLDAAGQVAIEPSLRAWHASRGGRDDVAQRHAQARGAPIPPATPGKRPSGPIPAAVAPATADATPPATGAAAPDADDAARSTHQARTLHWQNETLQVEIDLACGRRLDRFATLSEARGLGGTLRGAVERLIDQVAPRVAVATSPADRQRLLRNEVLAVKRELRKEFRNALRRLAANAGASTQEPTP